MGQSTDTAPLIDGTEPGEKEASYTTFGAKIASEGEASPAYLANRGLTGWGIAHCFEFPGYIRLEYGQLLGEHVRDPDHSQTHGAERPDEHHAHLRRRAVRLDVRYSRQGAGRGNHKDSQRAIEEGTAETAITPAADGQSIAITSTHCPKHANDDFKKWSCFTLTIDGATAETQIRWGHDRRGRREQDGRICLDNIAIRKN